MEDFVAQVTNAIRDLQAGQIAQTRMLRAVISTHPNADGLRRAWREFSAPSIVEAELAKTTDPTRRAMHEALLLALKDWDDRLERDLPPP
jgi:hypothetical protein